MAVSFIGGGNWTTWKKPLTTVWKNVSLIKMENEDMRIMQYSKSKNCLNFKSKFYISQ
jgi:hypothetical protein